MKSASSGDTVRVHYTGRLENGEVFDSSVDREPIEFVLGEGNMIPGFESAVSGMSVDESKDVRIAAEDAYGERRDDLVFTFERSGLPDTMSPEVGLQVELRGPSGQAVPALITDVKGDSVTVDANHPLSGEPLLFELKLVEIIASSSETSEAE